MELVECPTEAIYPFVVLDVCLNITSERGRTYSCGNKAALEAKTKTQMTVNQCRRSNLPYFGMTEFCICDTDGCNYEVRNHDLPHESIGNPVNSPNALIVYILTQEYR